MEKYIKRYKRWQREVQLSSPFVLLCGIIAILYFFYRLFLIITPAISIEQTVLNPLAGDNIVCGEEEGSHLDAPTPILSTGYQKRIQQQPSLAPNQVINPDLAQINPSSEQPVGYFHIIENNNVSYSYLQDTPADPRFLRVTNTKATPIDTASAAWQMNLVKVQPDRTYAYSFSYRSDVPVNVSLEYTTKDQTRYKEITTLKAAKTWQQFTAHFDNSEKATAFGVNINSVKPGQVDTRAFDIHQIPDASLAKGIVSVAFDDGWQSVNDKAYALLNKYHVRTTQYIISDVADHEVPGYMNFDMISRLKQNGHEIGSHSLRHCNQTDLSADAIMNNAVQSKQMLEKKKLGPIKSFAYPLGQYNEKTQAIYAKQYPLVRSSDFGYNDRYFDETDIHSIGVLDKTTDKEFQTWLDYAKSHQMWVVIVYHKVDTSGEYNVTSAQLERQLQMITASGLNIQPLSEAADNVRK
jgi:peptidoglycan/xylan/chitin deacetylase (PgdA/CDA1 family)